MSHGPRFRPAENADTPTRVGRIEDYLGRREEWSEAQMDRFVNLETRVASHDGKLSDLFAKVGEIRVRLGFIMLIAGGVGGLIAAVVTNVVSHALTKSP